MFTASFLTLYCHFSPLIFTSTIKIMFFLSKRLRLNQKELSDEKVLSLTKKKYGFTVHFL